MIDSLYDTFFRCGHRRMSFPRKLVSKPGAPQADMYVVCLDCGKQFHYDWEKMRIGNPVELSVASETARPDTRSSAPSRSTFRFIVAVVTLPLMWLIGKAALGRKRSQGDKDTQR